MTEEKDTLKILRKIICPIGYLKPNFLREGESLAIDIHHIRYMNKLYQKVNNPLADRIFSTYPHPSSEELRPLLDDLQQAVEKFRKHLDEE